MHRLLYFFFYKLGLDSNKYLGTSKRSDVAKVFDFIPFLVFLIAKLFVPSLQYLKLLHEPPQVSPATDHEAWEYRLGT